MSLHRTPIWLLILLVAVVVLVGLWNRKLRRETGGRLTSDPNRVRFPKSGSNKPSN
ncbi:MAG TPA: hypothetical protein VGI45_08170 [Terracidiphilus sp.]